jgi:hypothetical protein
MILRPRPPDKPTLWVQSRTPPPCSGLRLAAPLAASVRLFV